MHAFFATFLFAHVLSASADKQSVVSLDEAATAASLTDLCNAHLVDYKAISDKMRKDPYDKDGTLDCIEVFCKSNDVEGLKTIHSVPRTRDRYSRFGLLHATDSGNVGAIEFYAERDAITAEEFLSHAKRAAKSGHLDAVCYFLRHEKFPHFGDSGFSVLLDAAEEGHPDIVRWILDEYMTLSQRDLYFAAFYAHEYFRWDIIDVLIQHDFDISNDATGYYMPEIRSAYNAWKARLAVTTKEQQSTSQRDMSRLFSIWSAAI